MDQLEQTSNERVMTRAEWVKQARFECEQNLCLTPRQIIEESQENVMSPAYADTRFTEARKEKEKKREKEKALFDLGDTPELTMQSIASERSIVSRGPIDIEENHGTITGERDFFIRILSYRFIAAAIIAVLVIGMDLLHLNVGTLDSTMVKETMSNNYTIERIEQIVSAFAAEKILPVFGKGTNSDTVTDDAVIPNNELEIRSEERRVGKEC